MKTSTKIELQRSTVELTYEDHKYSLCIFNKTLSEHVTVQLDPEELQQVRKVLCNGVI